MIEKNRRNCAPSFSVRILVESLKEPTQRELAFFARRRELGLGVGLERREDGGIEMVPNPEERDDLAGAAIRGFCGLANVWNLSEIERASLLGLQEPEAYREIIAGHSVFTDEMMERAEHFSIDQHPSSQAFLS